MELAVRVADGDADADPLAVGVGLNESVRDRAGGRDAPFDPTTRKPGRPSGLPPSLTLELPQTLLLMLTRSLGLGPGPG